MSSAYTSRKTAACTIFFGQGENEPLGMKEANLELAVEFSTRKISISNQFFAIMATFVESGDVRLRQTH